MRNLFVVVGTIGALGCDMVEVPSVPLSDCTRAQGDGVGVNHIALAGDTLTVEVEHAGGCAEHDYVLCWPDQAFAESKPVQVSLEVFHDANGDSCEAMVTDSFDTDLTPLQEAYRSAYGSGAGTIAIHVHGQAAEYTF